MSVFGWDIPSYIFPSSLFALFALALLISRFSKKWENLLFKSAVAGFWALVALWLIQSFLSMATS